MDSINPLNDFNIIARLDLNVRSGDYIFITVLEKLTGNKYALGFQGKVFSAYSGLDLTVGEKLKVWVSTGNGQIILKLDMPQTKFVEGLASRLGLSDALSQRIISYLFVYRLPLDPALINSIKKIMKVRKKGPLTLENIIILVKKGFDINKPPIHEILDLLEYGEQQGRGKQNNNRNTDTWKKYFKLRMAEDGPDNPLKLVNSVAEEDNFWVFIPLEFCIEEDKYSGSIRININRYLKRVNRIIFYLKTTIDHLGEIQFYFVIDEGQKSMKLYTDQSEFLRQKKQNIKKLCENLKRYRINSENDIHNIDEDMMICADVQQDKMGGYRTINTTL